MLIKRRAFEIVTQARARRRERFWCGAVGCGAARRDWLCRDGGVAAASLAFGCNPRAGVPDFVKIHSSNPKVLFLTAARGLVMKTLRCYEDVAEPTSTCG